MTNEGTMEPAQLVIESSGEIITELAGCGDIKDVRLSEPYTRHSPADALESPISGLELTHVMQALTVFFGTVTAGLAFCEKLIDIIHEHTKKQAKKQALTIIIKDQRTDKVIMEVTSNTDIDQIKKKLKLFT